MEILLVVAVSRKSELVIPSKEEIQCYQKVLDPRLRGDDGKIDQSADE